MNPVVLGHDCRPTTNLLSLWSMLNVFFVVLGDCVLSDVVGLAGPRVDAEGSFAFRSCCPAWRFPLLKTADLCYNGTSPFINIVYFLLFLYFVVVFYYL